MSYKLGLILSMVFVVLFLLLGGDMMCLSAAYSYLDSHSISVGYLIAKTGRVDREFLTYLEDTYQIQFETISPKSPSVGDVVEYTIYRYYHPFIMANHDVKLSASRTTVIGYYG